MNGEWRYCGCVEAAIGGWGLWFAGKDLQPINGCRSKHSALINDMEPRNSGEQFDGEVGSKALYALRTVSKDTFAQPGLSSCHK